MFTYFKNTYYSPGLPSTGPLKFNVPSLSIPTNIFPPRPAFIRFFNSPSLILHDLVSSNHVSTSSHLCDNGLRCCHTA
jgi:hypothetical protein